MGLLTAPTYFKLQETKPGTILVNDGRLMREGTSERFGNRQFYFMDSTDSKLKCLSGGSLAYLIDEHGIDKSIRVKITYNGTETVTGGKFKGKDSHQFLVESLDQESMGHENVDPKTTTETPNLNDLE